MVKSVEDLLEDLITACNRIASFTSDCTAEDFFASRLHQSAVMREVTVLGEVARRIREVSPEFVSEHSELRLENIIGLRNRLSHAYEGINLDVLWQVVLTAAPQLRASAVPLLLQRRPAANTSLMDY